MTDRTLLFGDQAIQHSLPQERLQPAAPLELGQPVAQ
jgi:hypothetical protein